MNAKAPRRQDNRLGFFVAPWCLGVHLLLLLHLTAPAEIVSAVIPNGLGVNIHFTDAKPGELKMLADAGFKIVRMDFDWARIETERGKYDFSAYDRLIKSLDEHGLRALFILDYVNPLYDDARSPDTDEGRQAFARWAAAAVEHFKGRRILWEMYNEPNVFPFWRPKPNTDDYIKLALEVGRAIKNAAPDELYVGPACSGVDLPFLEACVKAGLLEYFDAVTVHPYRQSDPETVEDDYRALRQLIARYAPNGRSIPILSGEWGYSSIWNGFDEQKQAKMLARQWLINISNDVPVSIWYDWHDDGPDPKEPEHHFGTVHHLPLPPGEGGGEGAPFKPKPAYLAARTLTTQLDGFVFNKRLTLLNDLETYTLMFQHDEDIKLVAWSRGPKPRTVQLPLGPGQFEVMSHLGEQLGKKTSEGNAVEFVLTDAPVFIRPAERSAMLYELAKWRRVPLERHVRAVNASPSWEKQPPINRATQQRWISESWHEPAGVFFQRYLLIVTDAIKLSASTPVGGGLSVAVENPSGHAFDGIVGVMIGNQAQLHKISLGDGGTRWSRVIPVGQNNVVQLKLLETERGGQKDLAAWQRLRFEPVSISEASLCIRAEGDENVGSTQGLEFVAAPLGLRGDGAHPVRIDYAFEPGWKYVCLSPAPQAIALDGKPARVGMWVKGDGSGNIARLRFVDSTGQTFQPDGPKLDFTDWRYVEFPLDGKRAGFWGGAKDGIIHYPIKLETLFLIDSAARQKTAGTVYISSPTVVYDE